MRKQDHISAWVNRDLGASIKKIANKEKKTVTEILKIFLCRGVRHPILHSKQGKRKL